MINEIIEQKLLEEASERGLLDQAQQFSPEKVQWCDHRWLSLCCGALEHPDFASLCVKCHEHNCFGCECGAVRSSRNA